jgi:hypothetical protein
MDDIVCKNCGLINDYRVERKANNDVATCNGCGKFIKNIPYSKPALFFGKYAGKPIENYENGEVSYLKWVRNTPGIWDKQAERIKDAILKRIL